MTFQTVQEPARPSQLLEIATSGANIASRMAQTLSKRVRDFAHAITVHEYMSWEPGKKERVVALMDEILAHQPITVKNVQLLESKMMLVARLVSKRRISVPDGIRHQCQVMGEPTLDPDILSDSAPILARYWNQSLPALIGNIAREIEEAAAIVDQDNVITAKLCESLEQQLRL